MKTPTITKREFLNAISEGVHDGIRSCIMNATDMPTTDFFDAFEQAVRAAVESCLPTADEVADAIASKATKMQEPPKKDGSAPD